jgi:hypothetical protein
MAVKRLQFGILPQVIQHKGGEGTGGAVVNAGNFHNWGWVMLWVRPLCKGKLYFYNTMDSTVPGKVRMVSCRKLQGIIGLRAPKTKGLTGCKNL